MGPPTAVAQCRTAVRTALRDLVGLPRPLVLVAASGGPDSTALLHATCFVAPRLGIRVGVVTVDHGLQTGSAARARAVAAYATRLGAVPVSIWHVVVDGPGGLEAAARRQRRVAYERAAQAAGAQAVLVGHTRDDQAETVLLGLARGSGARSLAGMASVAGVLRRPLLGLPRDVVAEAARSPAGAPLWDDPHNLDPAFTRARVRHEALPLLERTLGPGVAAALARSADLLRADADALDGWAAAEHGRVSGQPGDLDAVALAGLPAAVRTRVLRRAAVDAGSPAGALGAGHVGGLDALVTGVRSGRQVSLPGGLVATRSGDRLLIGRAGP